MDQSSGGNASNLSGHILNGQTLPSSLKAQGDQDSAKDSLKSFHVDISKIHAVPSNQQQSELQQLGLTVFNQQEFEQGVLAQVDEAVTKKEEERAHRLLSKELGSLRQTLRLKQQEVDESRRKLKVMHNHGATNMSGNSALQQQYEKLKEELLQIQTRDKWLRAKLSGPMSALPQALLEQPEETVQKDKDALNANGPSNVISTNAQAKLVEQGEMTPFGTMVHGNTKHNQQSEHRSEMTEFEKYLQDQTKKVKEQHKKVKGKVKRKPSDRFDSEKNQVPVKKSKSGGSNSSFKRGGTEGRNYFDATSKRVYQASERDFSKLNCKKRSTARLPHAFSEDGEMSDIEIGDEVDEEERVWKGSSEDEWRPEMDSQTDNEPEAGSSKKLKGRKRVQKSSKARCKRGSDGEESEDDLGAIKQKFGVKKRVTSDSPSSSSSLRAKSLAKDDGTEKAYRKRLIFHEQQKAEALDRDSDSGSDMEFDGGYRVPGRIWNKLYRYQKTGVRWMWELHCQQAGGILGDEMGLGKTIQLISFLAGLEHSGLRESSGGPRGLGPTLVVCPTTVLHQWVKEFHTWWPERRVAILHSSGSYTCSEAGLVTSIVRGRGVLVTAFSSVLIHQELLLPQPWHYVVLDEGHKIRNPHAQITIACKQFKTSHRLILSGSPVQNNLKELWSLFDFIFPGKLGTLPDFMQHFSVPIVQGGYSNASQVAVQTAYKCACVLRDTINPYLLRRMKADVQSSLQLPDKNEQVLFCRLTPHQRDVYKEYLDSKECNMILSGNFMVFPGLITLRKVCNHPDLSTGGPSQFDIPEEGAQEEDEEERENSRKFGYWKRSGKMIVIHSLLKLWKDQGHRVLLFTQSRQMLDILEQFVVSQGFSYRRMDGGTAISARQPLINTYNQDTSIFVFLLTTRVGGLGVNLTGANRVVIYDPDWNPSTDTQARERAWRIGQRRDVTVYRLLTTGTIEEKIYHRQIFKQFLTNRVLKDPKQRRFFKSNDLYELFTLGEDSLQTGTETSAIFAGTGSDVRVKLKSKSSQGQSSSKQNRFDLIRQQEKERREKEEEAKDKTKKGEEEEKNGEESSSEDEKLSWMKDLAKRLSQQMEAAKKVTTETTQDNHLESGSQDNNSSSISGGYDKSSCTETTRDKIERTDNTKAHSSGHRKKSKSHKKEKKSKRHRRKVQDAKVDGETVAFLDRQSSYKPPPSNEEETEASSQHQDDYVLRRLLKKTGVHSALQHDRIMQSGQADYALVEMEAERVAKESARALKASRSACLQAGGAAEGVPTWTGREGSAGAPGARPRFGQKKKLGLQLGSTNGKTSAQKESKGPDASKQTDSSEKKQHFDGSALLGSAHGGKQKDPTGLISSAELLNRMRSRNTGIADTELGEEGEAEDNLFAADVPNVTPDSKSLELLTDLRNFMAIGSAVNGMASTEELLHKFQDKVSPQQTATFRAMLHQIATLNKNSGQGMWKLKPAFR